MKLSRNYITPFISLTFLVIGITGILMFFHLFDGYTEVVHEILGLFFIVCAIFHIILNWTALKIHFKKSVFLPALLAILTISALLIMAERLYPPVDLQIMSRIVKAPVEDAFKALQVDSDMAIKRLEAKGIVIEGVGNMEDIWIKNNVSPETVIDLILE